MGPDVPDDAPRGIYVPVGTGRWRPGSTDDDAHHAGCGQVGSGTGMCRAGFFLATILALARPLACARQFLLGETTAFSVPCSGVTLRGLLEMNCYVRPEHFEKRIRILSTKKDVCLIMSPA